MSKLGVDVGDEFPAEEIRRDENGEVHHHHYHYRRRYRGPFGLLRLVLVVMLITLGWRLVSFATYPMYWRGYDRFAGYPFFSANPFFALGGAVIGIVVIVAALWFLRNRDPDCNS